MPHNAIIMYLCKGKTKIADQSGRAVYGMNCFRSLERWDRGFEGIIICVCIYCVCVILCMLRPCGGLIPRPRSPTVCVETITKLKQMPGTNRGLLSHWWMNEWKVKLRCVYLIKHYSTKTYGRVDVQIHVFLTSALLGGELSSSRPVFTTPGKNCRYPLYKKIGGPQNLYGQEKSCHCRVSNCEPSAVQPVASRYNDWAVPTPVIDKICAVTGDIHHLFDALPS
jgi:hypothetical protein